MKALRIFLLFILGFVRFSAQADNDVETIGNSNLLADIVTDPQDEAQNVSRRIFGGESDFENDYNFVARLTVEFNTRMRTVCSGVVLTSKVIITVAHCLRRPGGETANRIRVTLPRGGLYIFQKNEIIFYNSYQDGYKGDVALLRKDTRLATFMRGYGTPPTIPVQTDTPYSPSEGDPATIVGWGQIPGSTLYPWRLRWARVSLITTEECGYDDIAATMEDNEMLCTGTLDAGACTGDWGGPLLTGPGPTVLQGLTIYKRGTCSDQANMNTAYFNVERVGEWIRRKVPDITG